jgi:hypothetical protein
MSATSIPRSAREANRHAPLEVVAYFDRVQAWLKRPAGRAELHDVREHCGHLYWENGPARFGMGYRQRLDMKQPGRQALEWLAERGAEDVAPGDVSGGPFASPQPPIQPAPIPPTPQTSSLAMINQLEVALDFIYPTPAEAAQADAFFKKHRWRPWMGKRQGVRYGGPNDETMYCGPRSAPNLIGNYKDEHCRMTGELNVAHMEWRAKGVRAVRSKGVNSAVDLLDFDHRAFWLKHLVLLDYSVEQLARAFSPGRAYPRKVSLRYARGLMRAFPLIQDLIHEVDYPGLGLRRYFKKLPTERFLPAP